MDLIYIRLVVLVVLGLTFKDLSTQFKEYSDITQNLSIQEFENIKSFVLEYGDRETYCTKVGNNPHFSFDGLELYLHPEVGQNNMSCDPDVSDFNLIVIRDYNTDQLYYTILIIRQGDLDDEQISLTHRVGMQEEKVYVLKEYDYDLDSSVENVNNYLQLIRKEIAVSKE